MAFPPSIPYSLRSCSFQCHKVVIKREPGLDYHVRPMVIGDFDQVVELWRSTEGIGMSDSDSPEAIADFLSRNPNLSLTARLESGRLVGAVLCGHDGRRGYLYHLAVTRDFRHQGIAKALLDRCLAGLRALGIQKCSIFVYENNSDGQAFWTHNGWKRRADLCILQRPLGFPQAS